MDILAVVLTAAIGFGIGAIWYGVFSRQWVAASSGARHYLGQPDAANSPVLYGAAYVCILLVAGMMRHAFAMSGIDTLWLGVVSGLGIGLFFIAPWITLNVLYAHRPKILAVIDGGYAAVACAVMGGALVLI